MNSMNARIKKLRKILNLTQEQFAKKIHVSRSNLGNIENGIINVTDRVVVDICESFNVNELWMHTEEGEIFKQYDKEAELEYLIAALDAEKDAFKVKYITFMLKQPDTNWDIFEKSIMDFSNYLNVDKNNINKQKKK